MDLLESVRLIDRGMEVYLTHLKVTFHDMDIHMTEDVILPLFSRQEMMAYTTILPCITSRCRVVVTPARHSQKRERVSYNSCIYMTVPESLLSTSESGSAPPLTACVIACHLLTTGRVSSVCCENASDVLVYPFQSRQ